LLSFVNGLPKPQGSSINGPKCGTLNEWTVIKSASDLHSLDGCANHLGSIRVAAPAITDLSPLSSLVQVDQSLEIVNCNQLNDLTGLNNLKSVGDKLYVHENEKLTSLSGLENFQSAYSGVLVYYNPALKSIEGLSGLTTVNPTNQFPFGIHVYHCPELLSLAGLGSLSKVGNSVEFRYLPKVTSLDGLPQAEGTVELRNMTVSYMGALKDIKAAKAFYGDGVLLTINDNAVLTSLDGLDHITGVSALSANDNPYLTSVQAVSGASFQGTVDLRNDWSLCDLSGLNSVPGAKTIKCDPSKAKGASTDLVAKSTGVKLAIGILTILTLLI